MPNLAANATSAILDIFVAVAGTDFALNAVASSLGKVQTISRSSLRIGNTPPDLMERSLAIKYPTINVFCEKYSNSLKEKFRTFSGTASVVVDVRHSDDQIQEMQESLQVYVTAACQLLDSSRGDMGNGLFYAGGYDTLFHPAKRGGRNFLQSARISLELDVSL